MNIVVFHVILISLLKTSSTFDRHFRETILPRGEIIYITKPGSQQHQLVASPCTDQQVVSLTVNQHRPFPFRNTNKKSQLTSQDGGETLGNVELIYPFPITTGGLNRVLIFPKNDDSVLTI